MLAKLRSEMHADVAMFDVAISGYLIGSVLYGVMSSAPAPEESSVLSVLLKSSQTFALLLEVPSRAGHHNLRKYGFHGCCSLSCSSPHQLEHTQP